MQLRPYQEEAKQAILGEWNKGITALCWYCRPGAVKL